MNINRFISQFYHPALLIFVTVFFSFTAWLIPDFGFLRKGFSHSLPVFSIGGLFVITVYLCLLAFVIIAYSLGRKIKLSDPKINILDDTFYYCLSFLAFLGVIHSWGVIIDASGGVSGALQYLFTGNANVFKEMLYENYEAGLNSFRYVSILSASLAGFRFLMGRKGILIVPNLLALLLTSLVASRLSIVFAFFIFVNLLAFNNKIRVNLLFVGGCVCLFVLLFALNYSRNYGFYENKGVGFFSAGISEIITYLGTPFQGSLAVGEFYGNKGIDKLILLSGIENSLTTNSAILSLYTNNTSIFFASIIIFICSFIIGMLRRYVYGAVFLIPLILLYCFAEFWRLYLFTQGIIITLILSVLVSIAISLLFKKIFSIKKVYKL